MSEAITSKTATNNIECVLSASDSYIETLSIQAIDAQPGLLELVIRTQLLNAKNPAEKRVKSRTCPTGRAVRMRRAEAAKGTAAGTMTVTGPHSRSGCATNRFLLPPIPRLP